MVNAKLQALVEAHASARERWEVAWQSYLAIDYERCESAESPDLWRRWQLAGREYDRLLFETLLTYCALLKSETPT